MVVKGARGEGASRRDAGVKYKRILRDSAGAETLSLSAGYEFFYDTCMYMYSRDVTHTGGPFLSGKSVSSSGSCLRELTSRAVARSEKRI